ncbi:MAG: hypothetical protein M3O41_14255 [Pseudomonadota bacterium]|nr:hypothetical protein [Pseudomonadota bacterium]
MPAVLTDVFGAVQINSDPKMVGNKLIGLRVFRSGSFADSEGVRRRYTRADLDKMAVNYHTLVEKGLLPNVPVREDHSRSIKSVVGYFTDVRRDGNFLVADIEFTEESAVQKYTSKTYRARSAEVGSYTDNDGNDYSPAILGVAFCDIPAVEGLYAAQIETYAVGNAASKSAAVRKPEGAAAKPGQDPNWRFDPMTGERISPTDQNGNDGSSMIKDVLLDLHNLKDMYAGDVDTETSLQQVVDALTAIMQDSDSAAGQTPNGDPNATPSPQAGNANPSNHSGDTVAVIQFALADTTIEVDDKQRDNVAAIQSAFAAAEKRATDAEAAKTAAEAERDTLKTEVETAEFAARDAKVDSWLAAKKIVPAQVEGLKAFAKTLSADQFTAQDALYTGAPVQTFATAPGTGTPAGPNGETDDNAVKIKLAKQGYAMLKTAGVSDPDKLKASKFAKTLVGLGVDPEGE